MSDSIPDVDAKPVESKEKALPEQKKPGPADEIRAIQMLIVNGIYPGNVAPQVVQAYKLLEDIAQKVEKEASKNVA
jgi:predicted sugar kinase